MNDGRYWDRYARAHRAKHAHSGERCLGSEWQNHERFIELLSRCVRAADVALEIGCGGGRITRVVAPLVASLLATDVSREMLRLCRERVGNPSVCFLRTDGFTLAAVADASADVVYSHDVFVHFSSFQVYSYLCEIRRVLKPGGRGLLSFYDFSSHFETFKDMSLTYWRERRFPPHMRIHFVTEEMLRRMLQDLGLTVVDVDARDFLIVEFVRRATD